MQNQYIRRFNTLEVRPDWCQFLIDDFLIIVLCLTGWILYFDSPSSEWFLLVAVSFFSLFLVFHLAYLRNMVYRIGSEVIIVEHGIFSRSSEYIELYRVVDFREHRSLFQRLFGLKTVSIYSGDRTTPRLDIIGYSGERDLVSIIRERVEYNKQRKGVYEITNRY